MKRGQQEKVNTYISTLTVNFGNNQSTKSKPHSKSHTSPSEEYVRSSTSYHSDAAYSYREAQEKSTGTYYRLIASTPANRSKIPEPKNEKENNSSFHSSKAYVALSTANSEEARSRSKKNYDNYDEKQPKNDYFKEQEYDKPSISTPSKQKPEIDRPSPPVTEKRALDHPKITYSNSSASSVTKQSPANRASKEMMTTTTTTTTTTTFEETQTLYTKAEVTSVGPSTDYGETDWYLDILLRMQSLEMKQQNLHTEYDFLGKLAKGNREDLKTSRDWARYNADCYKVQAY